MSGTTQTRGWGREGDPRVVCWPGLNLSAHAHFHEAGPLLAERFGLHVVAVEPPGWTTAPLAAEEYRPAALARLVAPLLEPRGVFLGWSWGATIGAHLGALAPTGLAALVLLDAGYTDLQDEPGFRELSLGELRAQFSDFSWDEHVAAARARTRSWRPALEARARAAVREQGDGSLVPLVAADTLAAAFQGVAADRPSAALPGVRCPVLLVVASDTVERLGEAPLDRFRAAVSHAEIVTLDSSHDLLADALEPTLAAVGEFMAKVA